MDSFTLVLITVFLTLAFEFSNGWHDAANSIATVVSTRVLTPFRAVLWAAFWNFIAAFVFGTAVAETIGKGHGAHRTGQRKGPARRTAGRHLLEPDHAHPWPAHQFLARAYGRLRRRRRSHAGFKALILGGWKLPVLFIFLSPVIGMIVGDPGDHPDQLDCQRPASQESGPMVPPPAVIFRGGLQPGPRHQRRAKRHGHHHHRAGRRRPAENLSTFPTG